METLYRKQNIIIFSAGETLRSGLIDKIREQLEGDQVHCVAYTELFADAHDQNNIALLPALMKKIPTFDFAVIVAEGLDLLNHSDGSQFKTMRDNALFELGMCIMALGASRVILLSDEDVHIPYDLAGLDGIGLKHITFQGDVVNSAVQKIQQIVREQAEMPSPPLEAQVEEMLSHIQSNARKISPVFVGAAVSSAEAYFNNFVIRLLEHADHGFAPKGSPQDLHAFPDSFEIKIIIPTSLDAHAKQAIRSYYSRTGLDGYSIPEAGARELSFHGSYDGNALIIVDVPTSITASYAMVDSILNIESDAAYDPDAEERFIQKELDVYEYALRTLCKPDVAVKRLGFLQDPAKKDELLARLSNVAIARQDVSDGKDDACGR